MQSDANGNTVWKLVHLLVGGEFDPLLELLPELVLSEADCSHTAVLAGYLQLTNTAQSPFIKDI
jgi:hypothetical protein